MAAWERRDVHFGGVRRKKLCQFRAEMLFIEQYFLLFSYFVG